MQTIGERLEEARKRKGVSIREAAEATKIRGDYLQKFESNQFDLGLAELYVRGFLQSYAQFLKLPAEKIVNDFNGLGLAANGRPRTPSREVYGRMDLSVASAEEAAASEPASPAPETPSAPIRRSPPSFSRGGGTLQSGPAIDPNLIFKGGLVVIGLVVLGLVIWGAKSLLGSDKAKPSAAPASTVQAAPQQVITLVALDTVRVTVVRKNADLSDGEELFRGTMERGQTQVVPKPGAIYITASAAENLEIEVKGKRYPTGFTGYKKVQLE
jgi:transcriptional regulator with XRE-family HTH domain